TAHATLERLLGDTAEQPLRSDVMTFLGQVYEDQGEFALAAQTLQRLGESSPRDRQAAAALRHSRELLAQLPEAQRPQPDPEQLLASLDGLAEGQLWQEIAARLDTLAGFAQPEALVRDVLLKRAALEVRRGRLAEASAALQEVLRRYPQGTH